MLLKWFGTVVLMLAVGWPRFQILGQQPVFRGGTDLVELDVVVTDKEHRPVRGLTAADFTVLEHGKPQEIAAFSAIDLPNVVVPSANWMRTTGSDVTANSIDTRRIVVIVMDDPTMPFSPGVTKLVRLIGHGIIDRLSPNDVAAVVYTYRGRNQNFTTDKAALAGAVDAVVPHPAPLACEKPDGCDIGTLINVADVLGSAPPGRKLIMFISGGRKFVDFDQLAGLTDDRSFYFRELLEKMQRANIAVYAFDPNGLVTGAGTAEMARPGLQPGTAALARVNETLRMFAEGTGGRAITDVNTPWEDVPDVFLENSSYYIVGFQPEDPKEDARYRKIQVKVNRPGVDVHARGGYFVPKPPKA